MRNEEINALPPRARKYIHDLETRCDRAHEVQERWALIEQRDGLVNLVRELEARTSKTR
ncbi:hypothetical protein [Sphingomonas sp. URHD0057]|uniref:hypothetical protein n=1 Tax=Sphingomonas sp. URHD0057 TaxID=1380389 RepID=UPI000AA5D724|nr:hypothetical protein [Sphingomonas sp. URHD0057]